MAAWTFMAILSGKAVILTFAHKTFSYKTTTLLIWFYVAKNKNIHSWISIHDFPLWNIRISANKKYDTFFHGRVSMLRHLNNVLWESATNVYQYRHFEMNVRACRCYLWLRVMRRERDTSAWLQNVFPEMLYSTTCRSWKWFKRLIAFQCDVIWVTECFHTCRNVQAVKAFNLDLILNTFMLNEACTCMSWNGLESSLRQELWDDKVLEVPLIIKSWKLFVVSKEKPSGFVVVYKGLKKAFPFFAVWKESKLGMNFL